MADGLPLSSSLAVNRQTFVLIEKTGLAEHHVIDYRLYLKTLKVRQAHQAHQVSLLAVKLEKAVRCLRTFRLYRKSRNVGFEIYARLKVDSIRAQRPCCKLLR